MQFQSIFPSFRFVCIDPEAEGRCTLQSAEEELLRLVRTSGGVLSHVLLLAKGSTDLHAAWLSAQQGLATAAGTAASEVHKPDKDAPSNATDIFLAFMDRPANAELAAAAAAGTCAVVLAGASMHAVGRQYTANGHFFRRLTKAELSTSDPTAAAFERFVGLEWMDGKTRVFLGAAKPF